MAQKRKSYNIAFKLKDINSAEKTSKEVAACEYNVDPKRVCEWCSKKDELVTMKNAYIHLYIPVIQNINKRQFGLNAGLK